MQVHAQFGKAAIIDNLSNLEPIDVSGLYFLAAPSTPAEIRAFREWIKVEFDWSHQTAYRFIHVFEAFRRTDVTTLLDTPLDVSGLYLLAAPRQKPKFSEFRSARRHAGKSDNLSDLMRSAWCRAVVLLGQPAGAGPARGQTLSASIDFISIGPSVQT
jgi:hypothetical protein